MRGTNDRPVTNEVVCLKRAVDLLKVAEGLAQPENIERYPGAIASVIRSARMLVEEVIEALTAYFSAQGDSTSWPRWMSRALVSAASARIDASLLKEEKADIEGEGPH